MHRISTPFLMRKPRKKSSGATGFAVPGSTGCQPVHLGSLPRCLFVQWSPRTRMLPASCRQLHASGLLLPRNAKSWLLVILSAVVCQAVALWEGLEESLAGFGQRHLESLHFGRHDGGLSAPLIDPIVHSLVPQPAVLRLKHPMAFIGKIQHFRRHLQHLQRSEKIESL